MLRLDLVHPQIQGNKWYKLQYNLLEAARRESGAVLSFGGAWSNHLYAMAQAGRELGIRTIGVIRGEEDRPDNPVIQSLRECGMRLVFVTREAYSLKHSEEFRSWLTEEVGPHYFIPEGGANFLGVNGCMEILDGVPLESYDAVCVACGTGATLAGLVLAAQGRTSLVGFSAHRGGEFLHQEVVNMLGWFIADEDDLADLSRSFRIETRWHFGGFGKWNGELAGFLEEFERIHGVPLDPVYTAKMMAGLARMFGAGEWGETARVLCVHTGGAPGRGSLRLSGG